MGKPLAATKGELGRWTQVGTPPLGADIFFGSRSCSGALFTAGLVTAGVVAGAGPLAVLSDSTPTESTTDPGATSTESTTDSETTTESTRGVDDHRDRDDDGVHDDRVDDDREHARAVGPADDHKRQGRLLALRTRDPVRDELAAR